MTEQEFRLCLGAYVLGALEPDENLAVETHLRECAGCRLEYLEFADTVGALGTVPPDVTAAGLAGLPVGPPLATAPLAAGFGRPPGGPGPAPFAPGPGSLAPAPGPAPAGAATLQRRPRRPATSARTTRRATRLVAAAVAVAAGVAAAVTVSAAVRTGRPGVGVPAGPTPTIRAVDSRTVSGSSPSTGVSMVVTLRAEPGGTRLDASVTGRLEAGWQCQLVVQPRTGTATAAGSMRVTRPADGIHLDGPVALPIDQISRVEIRRMDGQLLVSLPL